MDIVITGKCLLLNGPSSVGKSSVARELKRMLPGDWGILSLDSFFAFAPAILQIEDPWFHLTDVSYPNRPARTLNDVDFARMEELFPRFLSLFHQTAANMMGAGFSVIVDHVFNRKAWAEDFLACCGGEGLTMVGLECSPEELERREAARGDREPGMARYQAGAVHHDLDYDLIVDTTKLSPREPAERIRDYLEDKK